MPKISATWGAIGLIVFGVIVGGVAFSNPAGLITAIVASAGYIVTGIKYLYDHSETVYLHVQRWRCVMLGLDTSWDFVARITAKESFDVDSFKRKFLEIPGDNKRIIVQPDGTIAISFADTSFEIFPDGEDIDIHVNNMNVSYRMADSVLDKRIGPIIEILQRGIVIDRANFFLNVKFLDSNPFLGGYLRRIAERDLKGFNVNFVLKADEITVTKDKVNIKANTFSELVAASRRVLALSPGNS